MYVILNPKFRSCSMSTLEGFHTHRRSSAWWIRWSCLFAERFGCVMYLGGNATAASTVVPRKLGNSARISSHTTPAYEPALCPRISRPTPTCSANLLASIIVRFGGRQIPVRGCAASSCVKRRRLCLYPVQGGLRCAGVIGPNLSTRRALWMICA